MVFIDTGAFVGRYVARDQYHETAEMGWSDLKRKGLRCYTSSFVVDETLTLLGRRASYDFAAERGRRIYASKAIEILRPEERDEVQALTWFEKFADQGVSFTDCVSFALMKRYRLQIAFSFDAHFDRAGFPRWPQPTAPQYWLNEPPHPPYGSD